MAKKTEIPEIRMIPCKVKAGKTVAIGFMPGASVNGQAMKEFEDEENKIKTRIVMRSGETASLPEEFFRRHMSIFEILETTVDEFVERENAILERENEQNEQSAQLKEEQEYMDKQKAKLEALEEKAEKKLVAAEAKHTKELAAMQKKLDEATKKP